MRRSRGEVHAAITLLKSIRDVFLIISFLILAWLILRSFWVSDAITWRPAFLHLQDLHVLTRNGGLTLYSSSLSHLNKTFEWRRVPTFDPDYAGNCGDWRSLSIESYPSGMGGQYHGARLSMLLLPFPIVAMFFVRLLRGMRRRRHFRKERCLNCGYDLRGSAERCPECGTLRTKAVPKLVRLRLAGVTVAVFAICALTCYRYVDSLDTPGLSLAEIRTAIRERNWPLLSQRLDPVLLDAGYDVLVETRNERAARIGKDLSRGSLEPKNWCFYGLDECSIEVAGPVLGNPGENRILWFSRKNNFWRLYYDY